MGLIRKFAGPAGMGLAMVSAFVVATGILLSACGVKVTPPPPTAIPKLTQVTTAAVSELRITYQDSWYLVQVAEVCYDGVVYITTAKGGISAKFVPAGTTTDAAAHAYVQTCK